MFFLHQNPGQNINTTLIKGSVKVKIKHVWRTDRHKEAVVSTVGQTDNVKLVVGENLHTEHLLQVPQTDLGGRYPKRPARWR